MRRLVLMRHAHADDLGLSGGQDLARPLSASGRRDARRMGHWLAEGSVQPTTILTSGAARADQTVQEVAAALRAPADRIQVERRIYAAGLPALLQVLDERLHTGTLLLVGHNPGVAALALALVRDRGDPAADLRFPPGACAVVELPDLGDVFQQGTVRAYAAPLGSAGLPREAPRRAEDTRDAAPQTLSD